MSTPKALIIEQPPGVEMPDLPAVVVVTAVGTPLKAMTTTFSLDITRPVTITVLASPQPGDGYIYSVTKLITDTHNVVVSAQGEVEDLISYTNWLSATLYRVTMGTDQLKFSDVPDDYAPTLPRPVAQVGWDFEQSGRDLGRRYSLLEWGLYATNLTALPFQMIRGLWPLAQLLGPFGLFLVWLMIMFPVVATFKLVVFIKETMIQLIAFVMDVIKFLLSFVPFLG